MQIFDGCTFQDRSLSCLNVAGDAFRFNCIAENPARPLVLG